MNKINIFCNCFRLALYFHKHGFYCTAGHICDKEEEVTIRSIIRLDSIIPHVTNY